MFAADLDRRCSSRIALCARFLENNPVAAVLDYAATPFGRNDGQAVRLRFKLSNRKSIRECRKKMGIKPETIATERPLHPAGNQLIIIAQEFDVTLRECSEMGEDFVEMFEHRKANCSGIFWKFTVDPPTFLWNPMFEPRN